jgi:hypothetical protein
MAGFLSSNMESAIDTMYDTLHETFAQTITVFKNSKRTVISTNSRYNNIYGRTNTGSKSNIEYTTESQSFEARVYYINMEEEYLSNNENQRGTQNKIILPNGSVKIVVKSDAYEFIKEARRLELDGIRFAIKSDGEPSGLTSNKFYTFLLTPTDE